MKLLQMNYWKIIPRNKIGGRVLVDRKIMIYSYKQWEEQRFRDGSRNEEKNLVFAVGVQNH